MGIYADKRDGKLTGQFRLELERKGHPRYRKRHPTHQAAVEDEKRVLRCWEAGEDPNAPQAAPEAPVGGITLAKAIEKAEGILWHGTTSEYGNYRHLKAIKAILGEDTLLDAINTEKVRDIIRHLDRNGRANGTVNRYLSHFKTFLDWHAKEGNRTVDVEAINWDWRKESKGRLRWLSFEEQDKIISLVPTGTGKLIQVAIDTGCRREELMSAKIDQVDQRGEEDGLFHIWRTKNNEARSVPISAETAKMLRELLSGEMPSKRTLRRHWDKARYTMGLASDEEFVFHACRHTCATRMVDADVDILIIKEWLGHKRIETTQRYAKVKPKKLQSILGRVGGLRALEGGKASNSGLPHTPPHSPPGGENSLAA
jgi:integrase